MSVSLNFLGAAGTVTGSKYLVRSGSHTILVDAGLFQGSRTWREKNWNDPDIPLKEIDAVLLTHAHIDHTGILPRYTAQGLKAPIYATASTTDLTRLLLEDSGHLQEQEARYRAERGKSRHSPPQPLYTARDASHACTMFKPVSFHKRIEILPNVFATWRRMGHILGAASITLEIGGRVITFSGDIGRYDVPILVNPEPVSYGDLLLIESTYGTRLHADSDPRTELVRIINETVKRNGVVVIPSFAVGRAQLLLYYLRELKTANAIPDIPIIVDSPMADDATQIYKRHPSDYDEAAIGILEKGHHPFTVSKLGFVQSTEESIRLNSIDQPMVLISASGMLSGGRILHHLKHRISDPRNTILFVGYQPPGGRGDWIKSGADSVRIFGDEFQIRAHIEELSGLSAHGDRDEMLRWCRESSGRPDKVMVVHGEPESALGFSTILGKELNWAADVAKYLGTITI